MPPTTVNGPTPAGGDRAVARWTNETGEEVEQDDPSATDILIEEWGGDVLLARTYATPEPPDDVPAGPGGQDPGFTVAEMPGEPAKAWDMYTTDHRLVQTLAEFLDVTGFVVLPLQEQRQRVGQRLLLPSWQSAPQALRDEAEAWLVATRPARADGR